MEGVKGKGGQENAPTVSEGAMLSVASFEVPFNEAVKEAATSVPVVFAEDAVTRNEVVEAPDPIAMEDGTSRYLLLVARVTTAPVLCTEDVRVAEQTEEPPAEIRLGAQLRLLMVTAESAGAMLSETALELPFADAVRVTVVDVVM